MRQLRYLVFAATAVALTPACWALRADLNADGIVNFPDFAVMANEWLASSSGNSHVWHVDKDGDDSNGGHCFSNALLTIGAAVDVASEGDTIIIWPGTYDESVTVNKSLTLLGTSRYGSLIYPTTEPADALIIDANGCTVSGIHAKTQTGDYSAIRVNQKDDVVIENCIADGGKYGIETYFNVVRYFERMKIRDCSITGGYTGLYIGHAYHVSVERCQITTTGMDPVNGYIYGIRNRVGRNVLIKDCSVWVRRDYSTESGTLTTYGVESQGRAFFNNVTVHVSTSNVPLSGTALDTGIHCGGGTLIFSNGFIIIGGNADEIRGAEVTNTYHLLMTSVDVYLAGNPTTAYSLYNSTSGILGVYGCIYDTTKTHGTITGGW